MFVPPLDFARRVDGIDSITKGHWPIEFRRNIFVRVQRNSEDDDPPHTSRWTMKAIVVTNQAAGTGGRRHPDRPTASYQTRRG
jgi:hypothetical protein